MRKRLAPRRAALVSALAVVLSSSGLIVVPTPRAANASLSTHTNPSISVPEGIASGPDGALWFTNSGVGNYSIGRITTSGAVTSFTDPSIDLPLEIVSGPDGALWFTNFFLAGSSIGRITTSGAVTNFTDPTIKNPAGIVSGPDGALWFTNASAVSPSIGRITTAGVVTSFTDPSMDEPGNIASGPDGALWFTNFHSIGRITTSGAVTNFTDTNIGIPGDIVSGPDGALWFDSNESIGRITTSGVVTSFSDPSMSSPTGIVSGPDGALWFTNHDNGSIGRITTSGVVTNFADPSMSSPARIASGPDGALWFTDDGNDAIGRFEVPGETDSCSATQTCVGADGVLASVSTPRVSAVVTGKPDGAHGTVKLTFALGTLTCPKVPAGKRAVGTLTNTGYSKRRKLRLTITLRNATATSAAQVCLRKNKPFKSQSPATSKPGGGTGLLLTCQATKNVAPCVLSSKQVKTSVVVKFVVPGGDPVFSIQWTTGNRTTWLAKYGYGTVGKPYKAQLVAGGGVAPYKWNYTTTVRLPQGLTLTKTGRNNGLISGTTNVRGKRTITVQATDGSGLKTKSQSVPITINPRSAT